MAGGGVKINNIKVIGGANGKTPRVKIEGTNLYVSYDNQTWTDMGRVVGANGQDGATGAKIVSQNLVMIDSNGGYVYKQKFDDGTETTFTAPKGEKGNAGVGIAVGGTTGQFLVKKSEVYYDTEWKSISYVEKEDYERNILSLYSIVEGSGIVTNTEVEDSYHSRKTSGGLNIIDKSISRVSKISGNTISSKNLIPYPYFFTTITTYGLTFTANTDGSIKVNGTTTKKNFGIPITSYFYLPAGTYKLSGYNGIEITARKYTSTSDTQGTSWIDSTAAINETGTLTETTLIRVQLWCTADVGTTFNFTMFPMLNEGSTALPYVPYFSGLKNAGFKSILSTGKNLVNTDGLFDVGKVYNGLTCSKNADGTYKLSGTATADECYGFDATRTACYIPKGATIYFTPFYNITTSAEANTENKVIGLVLYDKDGKFVQQWNSNIYSGVTATHNTIALKDISKVSFVWRIEGATGLPVTIDNIKFMLSYENTNVYEPYKSDGIACESNLELAEFDYAVPSENKVYRQSATITFDGSEDESWTVYTYSSTGKIVFLSTSLYHGSITQISDGIVANVSGVKWASTMSTNSSIEVPSSSVGNVTTVDDLRTYLATNNLVVTYKKPTVTTEDVSFDKADYTAYLNGSESVLSDEDAVYPIITQSYYVKEGV